MPPLHPSAHPPVPPPPTPSPPPPSPPKEPFPPLSDVEEMLFDTAVCLDCALREFAAQGSAVDIRFFTECIVDELKDTEQYFLNANPQVHPILEYVSEIVSQTGTNSRELDLFGLSLSTVRDWCREAAWNCPTETGVIHIPNLTEFIDQIPNDYHWWMTDDITMAPPPVLALGSGSTNAAVSSSTHTSSQACGTVTYVDESNNNDADFNMDDNEHTPHCRTRLASKWHVISPGTQGPASKHPWIDDPDACGLCWLKQQACIPYTGQQMALVCDHCTHNKIGCKPLVKWVQALKAGPQSSKAGGQPSKAPKQAKGKGKKQNVAEVVDDPTLMMEAFQAEVAKQISALHSKICSEICSEIRMELCAGLAPLST